MTDTFEFTLNNPLTEEQWDMIEDVDFDRTDCITFHTKHGKEVEFAKVVRCKDCKFSKAYYHGSESNLGMFTYLCTQGLYGMNADDYCSRAERKEE